MSHRRSRSARQAFWWGLALFAASQVLFAWLTETALPQLRDPAYAVRVAELHRRLKQARQENDRTDVHVVVMLGSSRTANALRGGELERTLSNDLGQPVLVQNLGVPGAGPIHELLYFGRLLRDGIRPDLLLIEVLPVFLDRSYANNASWLPAESLGRDDLAILRGYDLAHMELEHDWRRGMLLPAHTRRGTIGEEITAALWPTYRQRPWVHRCDASGWLPQPTEKFSEEARRQARERARGEYADRLQHFQIGGPGCTALRRLVAECRRERIPAALVLMPEGEVFQSWYPPEAWKAIERFVAEVAAGELPVINARDWLRDDDLYDSHHPLNRGAAAFSARLGREAILPRLRNDGAVTSWSELHQTTTYCN
ncbi:hypothetical protein AYO44_11700 [Planctomycetaceae bacterium SCGC AG-212-F19]|nr:hypothetical protein AYO44_11700 [Planctomycetaceae bacterium SCGC AG-212-F19]